MCIATGVHTNILFIHLDSMFPCQFKLLILSMLNPQLPYQIAKVAKQIVAHLPESSPIAGSCCSSSSSWSDYMSLKVGGLVVPKRV